MHSQALHSRLHAWLATFAQTHNLKPQIELSSHTLYLVVGSPTLGRCEIDAIPFGSIEDWGQLETLLNSRVGAYGERVRGHLVAVTRVDGEIEEVLAGAKG